MLGTTLRPALAFPADDVGYGFDNIGDVLSLSPLQLGLYQKAAREVSEQLFAENPSGAAMRERVIVELEALGLDVRSSCPPVSRPAVAA